MSHEPTRANCPTDAELFAAKNCPGSLIDQIAAANALRDKVWEAKLNAGRELMRQAWHEFNAIRARDGAPVGVSPEWWDQMTEALGGLLKDDRVPWMLGAARVIRAEAEARAEAAERALADARRATLEEAEAFFAKMPGSEWTGAEIATEISALASASPLAPQSPAEE